VGLRRVIASQSIAVILAGVTGIGPWLVNVVASGVEGLAWCV